jgi:hypothetical protein
MPNPYSGLARSDRRAALVLAVSAYRPDARLLPIRDAGWLRVPRILDRTLDRTVDGLAGDKGTKADVVYGAAEAAAATAVASAAEAAASQRGGRQCDYNNRPDCK